MHSVGDSFYSSAACDDRDINRIEGVAEMPTFENLKLMIVHKTFKVHIGIFIEQMLNNQV